MEELKHQGTTLKIDPQNGAAVNYFSCSKDRRQVVLIDNRGYNLFEGSLLFPFPNRLVDGKFRFEGNEYEFPINDFGRPNALHGIIHNQPFQLIFKGEDYLHYEFKYDGSNPSYPFSYILEVIYVIKANELDMKVEVLNTGDHNMPCGFGWHPYFNLELAGGGSKLKLPKVTKIEVDKNMIPAGDDVHFKDFREFTAVKGHLLDNCFRLDKIDERNSFFLNYPGLATLEIWQDHNFPFLQIFKPDERSMAVEPMTCGINAFNTKEGLKVLSPQESWSFKMGLRVY